jgi:hypothetical protein
VVLALLCAALHDHVARPSACGPRTRRLIRRAQEFLDAELAHRISLSDVGRAVGASPAYLTDVFRHAEGVSLHQYLTHLRLARALAKLPHANGRNERGCPVASVNSWVAGSANGTLEHNERPYHRRKMLERRHGVAEQNCRGSERVGRQTRH